MNCLSSVAFCTVGTSTIVYFSGSFFCFFRFFFMWSFLSGMEEFKLAIFQRRCCCDCSARMYKYTMRLKKSAMVIVVAHGFSMVWLSDRRVKSSQNVPHSSVFSCFDGVSYKVVYYISHLIDIYACRNIKCTIIWIVWLLWWKEKGGRRGGEREKYIEKKHRANATESHVTWAEQSFFSYSVHIFFRIYDTTFSLRWLIFDFIMLFR